MKNLRQTPGPVVGLVILVVAIAIKQAGVGVGTADPEIGIRGSSVRPATGVVVVSMNDARSESANARAEAGTMFSERCAVCHGQNGDGRGPGADNLNPKPVDFRDRKWQRSVSDAKIAKAIVYGGPSVGLSESMAANPDLETQPGLVAALVDHVRRLGDRQKH